MVHILKKILVVLAAVGLSAACVGAMSGKPQDAPIAQAKAKLGIALTPRHFPVHSAVDVEEAFQMATTISSYAVFIYQWHEMNLKLVQQMVQRSKKSGLKIILGLSPTTLDQGRKELDLPEDIRRQAGTALSFANPIIREAFIESAKALARLRPPYLCLATEINFLALQRLDEYLHFVSLYKEAYKAIKQLSPETKVFVSFQWEWVRILDAREPEGIKEHSKIIDVFRPQLDVVGLTTYPAPFHASPSELPDDYYFWMYQHVQRSDEVLLMEVGWPTGGSGSMAEQEAFITLLPQLLDRVNVSVIAWALLHDVGLAEFDANLNTVGLIRNSGQKKPGYIRFKNLYDTLK